MEGVARSGPPRRESRHLRTSLYSGLLSFAHFRLFTLCSAGRDSRDVRFHASALDPHLRFYARLLRDFMGPDFAVRFALTDLASETPRDQWPKSCPPAELVSDPARASGRGYYTDVCFKIHSRGADGEWLEIGDGGAVDWTRKLLSNVKERLLISGVSSEHVCALVRPPAV
jgi:hypothetical protein